METETQTKGNEDYKIIKTSTYAEGAAKLREVGAQPKTFKENIEARVIAYENGDRRLFDTWLNSCTAVVNKERSTEFKIVPKSKDLITISEHFNDAYLPVTYADVKNGIELDSSKGKYNQLLEEGEPLVHEGWLAVVEEDKALLKALHDIYFKGFKRDLGMGFFVRQDTSGDRLRGLRALFVLNLYHNSTANGDYSLYYSGYFLLGSPVVGARSAREKNSGSAYRNPAMTKEERLHSSIEEELSRFDGFAGTHGQENYRKIKQEVAKNLKGLYKR